MQKDAVIFKEEEMKFKRFSKKFWVACFILLSFAIAHAEQFRAAMPSKISNSSQERLFEADNLTVKSFTNPVTFSCYAHVIKSEGGNILIDPGYYDGDLKDYIKSIGGISTVLLSHNHVDHIIGLNALKKDYPDAKVYIHDLDREGLYDIYVNYSFERIISEPFVIDFEVLPLNEGNYNFAGLNVKVISSAGHSPGSALYYFADKKLLFLGDTVAFRRISRHDLENSNVPELFESLMRLKNLDIPAETEVFFGHGERISYGDMIKTFEFFNKPLVMNIKTHDGKKITPVRDFYFDGDTLMVSIQEITKFLGTSYFFNDSAKSAVAYLPNMSKLKLKAGNSEAELDNFVINMKNSAQLQNGKIYLPGKFIAEILKPFLKWELKIAPDVVTLSYSDHEPLGNMRTRFLNEIFFPAIERESEGRIKILPNWNGKLSTSYNALKTVQEANTAQIATVVPEYFMNALTLHQIFKSFPVGPTGQEQVNFFRNIYERIPALKTEIEKQNLHVIFIATGFPAAFFSHEPLTDLRSIKGQKWRSASFWHKDFLQNAGAVPVTIPWGNKVFEALSDGSLDGLIVNIDSGYDIKAHTEAKYIAVSPKLWLGHAYLIAINSDVWNSLSENEHDAFKRAADFAYSQLGDVMDSALPEQIKTLQNDGADVRLLSDQEVTAWGNMTQYREIQDKWIQEKAKEGFSEAPEILEKVRKYIANQ